MFDSLFLFLFKKNTVLSNFYLAAGWQISIFQMLLWQLGFLSCPLTHLQWWETPISTQQWWDPSRRSMSFLKLHYQPASSTIKKIRNLIRKHFLNKLLLMLISHIHICYYCTTAYLACLICSPQLVQEFLQSFCKETLKFVLPARFSL